MQRHTIYGPGGHDPTHPTGNIVSETTEPDPPLDPLGALAALLAVTGVVSTDDAAAVIGRSPGDLVAEAEAWAVVAAERAKPKR